MTKIALTAVRTDGGTQTRAALNQERITDYSEAMDNGAVFPPVTVFFDGTTYWLADGFHRVEATRRGKVPTIGADIRQGTRRDAILYSVGANAEHGLHRSNEDKRRAVMALLGDAEWSRWSDREIAKQCGVGNKLVSDMRRSQSGVSGTHVTDRKGSDGKTYTVPERKPRPPTELEPEDDNDPGPDPSEDELDVYEADDVAPVKPEVPERRGWGESELTELGMFIAQAHRDFRERIQSLVSKVDPKFAADFRDRCADKHLTTIQFLHDLLPPVASRAAETRSKFQVVKGGK